ALPCYPIVKGATTFVFDINLGLRATPLPTSMNLIYGYTKAFYNSNIVVPGDEQLL
ncbi:hypothetical protein Tco_0914555, partial [Tanacetum coccineum]